MNTLAILLIIGSAVVGPIEAQRVTDWDSLIMSSHNQSDLDASCERMNSDRQAANACKKMVVMRLETLPELCERAMREIGGVSDTRNAVPNTALLYTPNGPHQMTTEVVRCIPVPTGYRK